ncbi:MAG TPA: inosine monophosphate cyclohydrolase [Chloroflexi bacterium]|nr:inosine monophosphate cyclohydrolase [Chloroflexota bacterium]
MTEALAIAKDNFERHIRQNAYPGRGLVIGRSSEDNGWLMIYWIMGRSTHSQNRYFAVDGHVLRTKPLDESKVEDPSLIIYEAMLELPGVYLASNGDQTRTVYEALQVGGTFDSALATREREPDAPNYTPRISGMLDLRLRQLPGVGPAKLALNILKANRANPALTDRFTYRPAPPPPGMGYCLTTYEGDGSPLPSFEGDPRLVPCAGDSDEVLETYWEALDEENRISLAVKHVSDQGGPGQIVFRNRFVPV